MGPKADEWMGVAIGGLVNLLTGTVSRWVDCEPSTRQRIYFGNHSSLLDFVVIWAALPLAVRRLTRPAAARDYWTASPVRRYLAAQIFKSILIDRSGNLSGAAQSLEAVVAGMGDECSLIIFPEGTRGSGEKIGPFKSGIYHIARRKPGLELVPVFMENLNRILPKGGALPAPLIGSVSFGKPLVLEPGESRVVFLERARTAIENLARV